jgi:hypothetical protein
MALNGISTLSTKQARQVAKLDLAAINRTAVGNSRASYIITQLPTQYDGNVIVDNPNIGGLVLGRPWIAIFIGMDNPANAAEPDATAWVLMDGPLYNTEGVAGSGFVGGQSWRKMNPIGYYPYGKETYIYGDEQVRWNGVFWAYVNDTAQRTFAISYDNVQWPWLATWTNNFTGAKITATYVKTTNYPAVP